MIDALYQLLARIGFTDPLHAPITHIPIGLVIGAFCFFYVAVIFNKKNMYLTARHVSILAFIFVFPTILFGVMDWLHFFKGALIPPIKMKMILASCVMVLLGTGIVLGAEVKVRSAPMMVIYALAVVGVVGLGWYGARLVYGNWAGSQPAAQAAAPAAPAAGGAAGGAPGAAPAAPSAARLGGQLFAANCAACHPGGANVVAPELPLKGAKQLASQDTFISFIRSPAMPNGSAGQMPAFPADQVSDTDAGAIYQYIQAQGWK
ncbi:MAG: c-type cytochrome [Spirochaetia bacterium]|jgi:mono/diheme cytochrome c family protein